MLCLIGSKNVLYAIEKVKDHCSQPRIIPVLQRCRKDFCEFCEECNFCQAVILCLRINPHETNHLQEKVWLTKKVMNFRFMFLACMGKQSVEAILSLAERILVLCDASSAAWKE